MSSTGFVNGSTLTDAGWFNDTDTVTYQRLTSVSGTNTIVATGPVSMTAYAVGQKFAFIPAATNTGATTINITPSGASALGARNIFSNGVALIGGELQINVPAIIWDDGTRFNLIGGTPGQFLGRERVQFGASGTATQNFVFGVPASPDGTIKLARGNDGETTSDIWSVNSAGLFTFRGTATNDSAAAGFNGEYSESVVLSGSAVSLVTGTAKTVTSIALTAGDWDVTGVIYYSGNAATTTRYSISGIHTTTNTLGAQGTFTTAFYSSAGATVFSIADPSSTVPTQRLSLSGSGTAYLIATLDFAVNTATAYGKISARRVR